MKPSNLAIDSAGENLLRGLIGRRLFWVFGRAFIVEAGLTVSLQFGLPLGVDSAGECHDYILIESEQHETPQDYLDYGCFSLRHCVSLTEAFGGSGVLLSDVSSIVVPEQNSIVRVRIGEAVVRTDREEIRYDAFIFVDLDDGRTLSIGHAPRGFEGVCATFGTPTTLGDPTEVTDRVEMT